MSFNQDALAVLLLFSAFALAAPPRSKGYSSSAKHSEFVSGKAYSSISTYNQPSPVRDHSLTSKYSQAPSAIGSHEPPSSTGSTKCYTTWGQRPPFAGPETSWTTRYSPCTRTSIITISKTTTPSPFTSVVPATITETSTASTFVLTLTETEAFTITDTITSTTTVVKTNTETTTTTTSTVIPAPPAFTPVQDSLPGSSYAGSGGSVPPGKRDLLESRDTGPIRNRFGNPGYSPVQYEQKIVCEAWREHKKDCSVETKTVTLTFAAATPTIVTTSTKTESTVFIPSKTTTVTTTTETVMTELMTTTKIMTVTETKTESIPGPTPTIYEACLSNNLADTYSDGQGFDNLFADPNFDFDLESSDQASAYDCCVHVFTDTPRAAGYQFGAWAFGLPGSFAPGTCFAFSAPVCPVQQATSLGNPTFAIGNGPCGSITSLS